MKKNGFCGEYIGKGKSKQKSIREYNTQTLSNPSCNKDISFGNIATVENGLINVRLIFNILIILYRAIKFAIVVIILKLKVTNAVI